MSIRNRAELKSADPSGVGTIGPAPPGTPPSHPTTADTARIIAIETAVDGDVRVTRRFASSLMVLSGTLGSV